MRRGCVTCVLYRQHHLSHQTRIAAVDVRAPARHEEQRNIRRHLVTTVPVNSGLVLHKLHILNAGLVGWVLVAIHGAAPLKVFIYLPRNTGLAFLGPQRGYIIILCLTLDTWHRRIELSAHGAALVEGLPVRSAWDVVAATRIRFKVGTAVAAGKAGFFAPANPILVLVSVRSFLAVCLFVP